MLINFQAKYHDVVKNSSSTQVISLAHVDEGTNAPEKSSVDALLKAEGMAHEHEKHFNIGDARDRMAKSKGKFKNDDRSYNQSILQNEN